MENEDLATTRSDEMNVQPETPLMVRPMDDLENHLAKAGLKPTTTRAFDTGPEFTFKSSVDADRASEVLTQAGHPVFQKQQYGDEWTVMSTWTDALREDRSHVYGWLTPGGGWVQADFQAHADAVLNYYKRNVATSPGAQQIFRRIKLARNSWKVKPTWEQWQDADLPIGDYTLIHENNRNRYSFLWYSWAFDREWIRSTGDGINIRRGNITPAEIESIQKLYSGRLIPGAMGTPENIHFDLGQDVNYVVPYKDFLVRAVSESDLKRLDAQRKRLGVGGAQFFQPESTVSKTVHSILTERPHGPAQGNH